MATDAFANLLEDLGRYLNIQLVPDENRSCLLHFKDDVLVQIEILPNQQNLLLGSDLGEVLIGPYRDELFQQALRANGLAPPLYGRLGYNSNTNHLFLFEMLPLKELAADKVVLLLEPFCQKAKTWKNAIQSKTIPAISSEAKVGSSGIFGLK